MRRNILLTLFVVTLASVMQISARSALAIDLYWNDAAGIHQRRDDADARSLIFETFETRGVAVDAARGRLVWSDVLPLGAPIPGGVIREGKTTGGAFDTIASRLTNPAGVAIDPLHGNIYWTDVGDANTASMIYMARRDGSEARPIIRGEWLAEIAGIAVDPRGGKLYFSYVNPLLDALYTGGIGRANLDGSNAEGIIGGLGKPIGVAVDPEGSGVYWADARSFSTGGGDGRIETADLRGEHRRIILGGLEIPYGVALDLEHQDVYWTDQATGKIQRTAMSGILPYFQDVVTGLVDPTAIAIASAFSITPGDANADGRVNRTDLAIVATNYGMNGAAVSWSLGDFNSDHQVSLADLMILQQHLSDSGISTLPIAASVPEPTSWTLLGLGIACLVAVRRVSGGQTATAVKRKALDQAVAQFLRIVLPCVACRSGSNQFAHRLVGVDQVLRPTGQIPNRRAIGIEA